MGDTDGVFLVTFGPGTFVSFVREVGSPALRPELPVLDGPPDVARLNRIASDHGITLLGPPGTIPSDLTAAAA